LNICAVKKRSTENLALKESTSLAEKVHCEFSEGSFGALQVKFQ